jgi:hypothetical protein
VYGRVIVCEQKILYVEKSAVLVALMLREMEHLLSKIFVAIVFNLLAFIFTHDAFLYLSVLHSSTDFCQEISEIQTSESYC